MMLDLNDLYWQTIYFCSVQSFSSLEMKIAMKYDFFCNFKAIVTSDYLAFSFSPVKACFL